MEPNAGKIQRAVGILQGQTVRNDVLLSCLICGITSHELVEVKMADAKNYKEIWTALKWLTRPNRGLLPLLSEIPMRIAGRDGRPSTAYFLTEFGESVSKLLYPQHNFKTSNPHNADAVSHRISQLEIYTRVCQMGWVAEIEKKLEYNNGQKNVRCDVLAHHPNMNLHMEIEHDLPRNNLWRAEEKFIRWQEYAKSEGIKPQILFVFNLPESKVQKTLRNWQEALGRVKAKVGELAFEVDYVLLGKLVGPLDKNLEDHVLPMHPEIPAFDAKPERAQSQPSAGQSDVPDYVARFYDDFNDLVWEQSAAAEASEKLMAFFDLARGIYDGSYYRGSPSDMYAETPRESIWLLRYYLELSQNEKMLTELKEALDWVARRSGQMGLIMFRNVMTKIIWDVFLEHHGFSRGGALNVVFNIPDFQDTRSDFSVKVSLSGNTDLFEWYQVEKACDALSWVLSSLFIYSEKLGLGERPWKQSAKKAKNGTDM